MLVSELFPHLTKQVLRDLRRLKRADLAEQVMQLDIVERFRCGMNTCGTFYTQTIEFRKRIAEHGTEIMLECGASLTEVDGKIVEIETLDPEVEVSLRQVIP